MGVRTWLVAMTLIVVFVLIYNVFSGILSTVEPVMQAYINETVTSQNSTIGQQALTTLGYVDNAWTYWIILLIFGLIMWAFISASRREAQYEAVE